MGVTTGTKPQNTGLWYDQDPGDLARCRREEAARCRQGAAKARSLLGTLDGGGQRGFLFTERERLTTRMHDSERLAADCRSPFSRYRRLHFDHL